MLKGGKLLFGSGFAVCMFLLCSSFSVGKFLLVLLALFGKGLFLVGKGSYRLSQLGNGLLGGLFFFLKYSKLQFGIFALLPCGGKGVGGALRLLYLFVERLFFGFELGQRLLVLGNGLFVVLSLLPEGGNALLKGGKLLFGSGFAVGMFLLCSSFFVGKFQLCSSFSIGKFQPVLLTLVSKGLFLLGKCGHSLSQLGNGLLGGLFFFLKYSKLQFGIFALLPCGGKGVGGALRLLYLFVERLFFGFELGQRLLVLGNGLFVVLSLLPKGGNALLKGGEFLFGQFAITNRGLTLAQFIFQGLFAFVESLQFFQSVGHSLLYGFELLQQKLGMTVLFNIVYFRDTFNNLFFNQRQSIIVIRLDIGMGMAAYHRQYLIHRHFAMRTFWSPLANHFSTVGTSNNSHFPPYLVIILFFPKHHLSTGALQLPFLHARTWTVGASPCCSI